MMNPTLFDVISWVETKSNSIATRFEPAIYTTLTTGAMTIEHKRIVSNIAAIHNCSTGTAQQIYSTSYGAVQIMGFNLYGMLNCPNTFFELLTNVGLQEKFFDDFCFKNMLTQTPTDLAANNASRLIFAMKYNGGPAYAECISQALEHFGMIVV